MSADRDKVDSSRADGVEIWARRIGRTIGWAVAAFLLIQLLRTYAS
jgi:Na+(H+)/acetate symporter ActP